MNAKVKEVQKMLWDILATKGVEVDDTLVVNIGGIKLTEEEVIKMYDSVKAVHDTGIRGAWKLMSTINGFTGASIKFYADVRLVHMLGLLFMKKPELVDVVKIAADGMKKVVNMKYIEKLNKLFEHLVIKESGGEVFLIDEWTYWMSMKDALEQIFKVGDLVVNFKTVVFKYMLERVKNEIKHQRQMIAGIQGPSKKFIAKVVYEQEIFSYQTMLWKWVDTVSEINKDVYIVDCNISMDIPLWKAEWLAKSLKKSDYMIRERTQRGPNGEEYTYSMMSILDEIEPVDLVNGINTSARVVCEHCIERRRQERYGEWLNDHDPVPECPIGDHPEIDMYQIKTPAEIVMEGEYMDHCVGDYAGAAKAGATFIYHVGKKAPYGYTVQIDIDDDGKATIVQAFGYKNSIVDYDAVKKVVKKYNKKINRRWW